jgi:FkbM family methyltransferase
MMESMNGGSGRTERIKRLAAHFAANELHAAERIAQELLDARAQDEEAQYLLAQIVFRQGRFQEAIERMRAVLEIDPARASYNNDYGVMLAAVGRWGEALAAHEMATVLDRNDADARFNLALARFRSGDEKGARQDLEQALMMRPGMPEALALEGELLRAEGRLDEAANASRKAIEEGLKTPEIHVNLYLALKDMGCDDEASMALLESGEDDARICWLLGNMYREKGCRENQERSRYFFRRALALRPGFAEAYANLGLLLQDMGETGPAALCLAHALANNPNLGAAYVNLGNLGLQEAWAEDAICVLERAVQIDPDSAMAQNNLSIAFSNMQRIDEAERALHKALEIQADFAEAHLNLGLLYLLSGRFSEAWPYYEKRGQIPGRKETRPQFESPEWEGEDLGKRTLLVYSEQGLGDSLQFVRYLPLLRQRFPEAKIHYLSQSPLSRLFASQASAWDVSVLPPMAQDRLPPFDVQISIMSLPWRMGTTLENIPAGIPYIRPPQEWGDEWSIHFNLLTGLKVGLVWSGGNAYSKQKLRSMRLRQFEPLLEVGGIHWVSLQKGEAARQIAEEGWADRIFDPMGEARDFADTAAIVAGLDLIISVDTSVLHLAGAMGKPVWLLNRFDTDWRWMLEREDSPWYPTMQIFRQTTHGNWDLLMPRVAQALSDKVAKSGGDSAHRLTLPQEMLDKAAGKEKTRMFAEQVFGDEALKYRIVRSRHGWMLANPKDIYVGQALLDYGEFSEIEARFLSCCLLKPGGIVEVGANMGGHTVGLAKAAAARGEEMAVFEPQPVIFQNLCANLALNGLHNVRAWPFACGDETGTLSFPRQDYGRLGNFGGVSMSDTGEEPGRVTVPCVRLDDFLGEEAVALIKIDVEGFELAVLRGADETLRSHRPILYVENDRAAQSKELIEWLWSREYRLFWHIPPLFNPENFFSQPVNRYRRTASFNMLCLPREFIQDKNPGLSEIVDSSHHPLHALEPEKS